MGGIGGVVSGGWRVGCGEWVGGAAKDGGRGTVKSHEASRGKGQSPSTICARNGFTGGGDLVKYIRNAKQ